MKRVLTAAMAPLFLLACSEPPLTGARWVQRQARVDPLTLWRVEVVDAAEPAPAVLVCADSVLHRGFQDARPNLGGERCAVVGDPVVQGASRSLRCVSGGQRFAVVSSVTGDVSSDFTVRMHAAPAGGRSFVQTRKYRRLGGCPEGWRIGDHTDAKGRRVSSGVG